MIKIKKPSVDASAFIHPSSIIIGDVSIDKECGVYPHAVIRGDQNRISIKEGSNVQDCCVIHVDDQNPVSIGKHVSIGHAAMVHGATIEDECIIGIHSIILNGAVIKRGSIIGANALVPSGTVVDENSLVIGTPGKVVKQDIKYRTQALENAEIYKKLSKQHQQGLYQQYKI
jgi:carbonic anhydrase/acetyltransferase-like protein (isoleucine patch superfamily)